MPTIAARIIHKPFEVLEPKPQAVRYSELVREVQNVDGRGKKKTVQGSVWNLDQRSYSASVGITSRCD